MKAARIHKHGGREVLRVEDIPSPELHAGQVCIKLKTSALNHLDIWVREGIPGVPLPLIMGSDGAGEICKLGEKADKFSVGDPVIIQPLVYCDECRNCQAGNENLCEKMGIRGESTDGTNCEFIVLDEKFVESKPDNISFAEAAAFPLVGQTAYQMLVNRAKIQPGENVLVWGAGSGVGHMAVQIARALIHQLQPHLFPPHQRLACHPQLSRLPCFRHLPLPFHHLLPLCHLFRRLPCSQRLPG